MADAVELHSLPPVALADALVLSVVLPTFNEAGQQISVASVTASEARPAVARIEVDIRDNRVTVEHHGDLLSGRD